MFIGNGFFRRKYVTRREICALALAVTFFSILFLASRAVANNAAPSGIFSPEADVIWSDLHSGVYDEDIERDLLDLVSELK